MTLFIARCSFVLSGDTLSFHHSILFRFIGRYSLLSSLDGLSDVPGEGENLIVGKDQDTDINWISGYGGDGILTVEKITNLPDEIETDMRLSDEFELSFRTLPESSKETYIFLVSGEHHIELKFNMYGARLNDATGGDSWRSSDVNDLRLYVKGNVAKLYVNNVFYQKDTLDWEDSTYTTYTSAVLMEVPLDTKIYEINIRKIQDVRDCAGTVNGDAYIDSCGNCVGGTTNRTACALGSEEDFLQLDKFNEGTRLNDNLVVGMDGDTLLKWISGFDGNGKFTNEDNVNLSGEFELSARVLPKLSTNTSIYLASDNDVIELKFNMYGARLNDATGGDSWRTSDVNYLKLYVKGNEAKLYVNDVFYQKDTLNSGNLTYSKILINDLPSDQYVYSLTGRTFGSGGHAVRSFLPAILFLLQ